MTFCGTLLLGVSGNRLKLQRANMYTARCRAPNPIVQNESVRTTPVTTHAPDPLSWTFSLNPPTALSVVAVLLRRHLGQPGRGDDASLVLYGGEEGGQRLENVAQRVGAWGGLAVGTVLGPAEKHRRNHFGTLQSLNRKPVQ